MGPRVYLIPLTDPSRKAPGGVSSAPGCAVGPYRRVPANSGMGSVVRARIAVLHTDALRIAGGEMTPNHGRRVGVDASVAGGPAARKERRRSASALRLQTTDRAPATAASLAGLH